MRANELRIGNWILFHNGLIQVEPLMIFDIHNGTNKAPHFKPIPLTEEWLLKWGFEIYNDEFFIKLSEYDFLCFNKITKGVFMECTEFEGAEPIVEFGHIKHIHQLQNLYFALSGQELEVTL